MLSTISLLQPTNNTAYSILVLRKGKDKELHVSTREACDPVLDMQVESHLHSCPRQTLKITFVHILKQLILSSCQEARPDHKISSF